MPWPMSHEPHGHTTGSQIPECQRVTSVTSSSSKGPHEPHLPGQRLFWAKAKLKVVWGRKWLGGPCPAGLGMRASSRPWRGDPHPKEQLHRHREALRGHPRWGHGAEDADAQRRFPGEPGASEEDAMRLEQPPQSGPCRSFGDFR